MCLVGQAERQRVGVVVDFAELLFTFVLGFVVVQAGGQAQFLTIAQHMAGAEVVLVPEVLGLGGPETGGQAGERVVGDAAGVDVVGFDAAVTVFGAEALQALFHTWRHTVKGREIERQVVQFADFQACTLEARRQRTVADGVDLRAAVALAADGQGAVGDACLDVGQAQLAPLVNGVAIGVGEGTVGTALDVFAAAIQRDGVVRRHFSAQAYGALGETRGVVEDGALDPVDPATTGLGHTVALILEGAAALLVFVGVPVAGRTAQGLTVDEAGGFALGVLFFHADRGERLALGFRVSRGGDAADGQGQYRGAAQFHG
ncbi:hypothetical protein D3C73_967680 [compost metagenome]